MSQGLEQSKCKINNLSRTRNNWQYPRYTLQVEQSPHRTDSSLSSNLRAYATGPSTPDQRQHERYKLHDLEIGTRLVVRELF